jgi:hypothetical protein
MPSVTMKTYRIVNVTDATEYNALSDNNKAAYNLIMSCGITDLEPGSPAYNHLWSMFPEGTTTGDALRDPANRFLVRPAEEE